MTNTWTKKQSKDLEQREKFHDEQFKTLLDRLQKLEGNLTERFEQMKTYIDDQTKLSDKARSQEDEKLSDLISKHTGEIRDLQQSIQQKLKDLNQTITQKIKNGLQAESKIKYLQERNKTLSIELNDQTNKGNHHKATTLAEDINRNTQSISEWASILRDWEDTKKAIVQFVLNSKDFVEIKEFFSKENTQTDASE